MSRIKVRGVMCSLHGGMNASSQLQPCNFQKRRSHLRSKHSILVSLYDCSCALMYFSTPLSFVQRNRTYCSVVRHLVVRSKTVPSRCYSLEVEKKKKILKTRRVFLPLVLHFVFYTWCAKRVECAHRLKTSGCHGSSTKSVMFLCVYIQTRALYRFKQRRTD